MDVLGPVFVNAYNIDAFQDQGNRSPIKLGAKGDGEKFLTASISSTVNTTTLTVTGASFTASYVNKIVSVKGAGASGRPLSAIITAVPSSTTLTVSVAASTTVSNTDCWIGTDNTSAFLACVTAGPGKIIVPPGVFLFRPVSGAPGVLLYGYSGIELIGSGRGITTLATTDWSAPVIGVFGLNAAATAQTNLENIKINSLDITSIIPVSDRSLAPAQCGISINAAILTSSGNNISKMEISNCSIYGTMVGINTSNGLKRSLITGNHIYSTVADGIGTFSKYQANEDNTIAFNNIYDTGDDSISDNKYAGAGLRNKNYRICHNVIYNSGSRGITADGCDGVFIHNNTITKTFGSGILVSPYVSNTDLANVKNARISNNHVFGAGTATRGLGIAGNSGITVQSGGIVIWGYTGYTSDDIKIDGNHILPDGANNSVGNGIAVYSQANASGNMSNVRIIDNEIVGPFSTVGTGQQSSGNKAGIFVDSCTDIVVNDNKIKKSGASGIIFGANTVGLAKANNNDFDAINQDTGSSEYCIQFLGANSIIQAKNNTLINKGTLANAILLSGTWPTISRDIEGNSWQGLGYGTSYSYSSAIVTQVFTGGLSGALVGKTTTTGGLTWILAGTTTPTSPGISSGICSGGATAGGAIIPVSRRNYLITSTINAISGVDKAYILVAGTSANVFLRIDLYNGAISTYLSASTDFPLQVPQINTLTASDKIAVDVSGDTVRVYRIRSGTWLFINQATIPEFVWSGTYAGIYFVDIVSANASITDVTVY